MRDAAQPSKSQPATENGGRPGARVDAPASAPWRDVSELASRVSGAPISAELLLDLRRDLGGLRAMLRLSAHEIAERFALGEEAVTRLQDALRLAVYAAEEADERILVRSAASIYERFAFLSLDEQETLWVASLDAANRLLETFPVARGDARSVQLDPADVLEICVVRRARRIIAVHNHPGGSADASPQDLAFTRKLIRAARYLGIRVLDHVIIGHGVWSSVRDRALMPFDD